MVYFFPFSIDADVQHKRSCRLVCCGFTLPRQSNISILYGVTFPTAENEISYIHSSNERVSDGKVNLKRKLDKTSIEKDNVQSIADSNDLFGHSTAEINTRSGTSSNEIRIRDISKFYWPLYGGKSGPRTIFTFVYEF
jgi:hypothetical protein